MDTKTLWDLNKAQLKASEDTTQTGAELMARTDISPERKAQSDMECAERRWRRAKEIQT